MIAGLVIGLAVGLVLGLVIGWLLRAQRQGTAEAAHAAETADLRARLAAEQTRQTELVQAQQALAASREEERQQLKGAFAELSLEALRQNFGTVPFGGRSTAQAGTGNGERRPGRTAKGHRRVVEAPA